MTLPDCTTDGDLEVEDEPLSERRWVPEVVCVCEADDDGLEVDVGLLVVLGVED